MIQLKKADNRVLQEQLQNKVFTTSLLYSIHVHSFQNIPVVENYRAIDLIEKLPSPCSPSFCFGTSLSSIFVCWQCAENRELQEKVELLEHQLASVTSNKLSTSSENCLPEKYVEEFKKKIQSQASLFSFGYSSFVDY